MPDPLYPIEPPDERFGQAYYEGLLDSLIGEVLGLLERAAEKGFELDPLAAIVRAMQARGTQMDLEGMPPMMRMLLAGMLES